MKWRHHLKWAVGQMPSPEMIGSERRLQERITVDSSTAARVIHAYIRCAVGDTCSVPHTLCGTTAQGRHCTPECPHSHRFDLEVCTGQLPKLSMVAR